MKLSTKLNSKVTEFTTSIANFSKKLSEAEKSIKELDSLVEEGDLEKENQEKFTEKAIAKFNKTKEFCKNFSEESKKLAEDADKISTEVSEEVNEESKAEAVKFGRKLKMISKRFSDAVSALDAITTEAEAVVNMKPEDVVKAEPTSNAGGTPAEGAEVTTQKSDTQTAAESTVNFSLANYYDFAAKSILKSFAEVKDNVEDASNVAEDAKDSVTMEPEPQAVTKDQPTPPMDKPTETEIAEEVEEVKKFGEEAIMKGDDKVADELNKKLDDLEKKAPGKGEEVMTHLENFAATVNKFKKFSAQSTEGTESTEDEIAEEVEEVKKFGEEAIMKEDKSTSDELTEKIDNLEKKSPGKGEEVMTHLENFSENFKAFKAFAGKVNSDVYSKIKEFSTTACENLTKKVNIDPDELGAKAEDLEKNQPGAGELLTSVLECFGKLLSAGAIKVPVAPDAPIPPKTFCMKDFCGVVDKFLSDVQIADKRFSRDVTTKCFNLQNAIEDDNKDAVKFATKELANALDASEDEKVKAFGEELVKFAEEVAKAEKPAETQSPAPEGSAVPEQISKADEELNNVIDKLSEKGEQLKPEVASFAKKLCFAYKSIKCFTEKDLEKKLEAVESLKKDFDEGAKVEKPATSPKAPESTVVEEPQVDPINAPSDASLKNFSIATPSVADDPLGHLASLDIR